MPSSAEEDLSFIMACLKHTENRSKPDFAAVAEELGLKAKTCYHRHWNLLKRYGQTGSRAANAGSALNNNNSSAPATPAAAKRKAGGSTGAKRGRKKKADAHTTIDDAEDDIDGTPSKRVKAEAENVIDEDKLKTASAAIEIDDDADDDGYDE